MSNIRRCLCTEAKLKSILLKHTLGWNDVILFLLNIISFGCLLRSELKLVFHWTAQSLINFKSLLISLTEVLTPWATKNNEVSAASNLHSLLWRFGKSLTYIKNKSGPRMEPCGTSAWTSTQDEHWLFKTTLCFMLVKKYVVY